MLVPIVIGHVAEFFHDNYGRCLHADQNKRNDEACDAHECLDVVYAGLHAVKCRLDLAISSEVIFANDVDEFKVGLVNVDHNCRADQCYHKADLQQSLQ